MRLSERYKVPIRLALLYEFMNTLDCRRFVEQGAPHQTADEIATQAQLAGWLQARQLLASGACIGEDAHQEALRLRAALRDFIALPPESRAGHAATADLTQAAAAFPLAVQAGGGIHLGPAPGASPLGAVLAELFSLEALAELGRLKTCASEECRWVFFDRSKPGNRRWCSSALCGNREKTRNYRNRHRD